MAGLTGNQGSGVLSSCVAADGLAVVPAEHRELPEGSPVQVVLGGTDYADLVLPATTSMEHTDCYKSYGHFYVQLARPVIAPAAPAEAPAGDRPPTPPPAAGASG